MLHSVACQHLWPHDPICRFMLLYTIRSQLCDRQNYTHIPTALQEWQLTWGGPMQQPSSLYGFLQELFIAERTWQAAFSAYSLPVLRNRVIGGCTHNVICVEFGNAQLNSQRSTHMRMIASAHGTTLRLQLKSATWPPRLTTVSAPVILTSVSAERSFVAGCSWVQCLESTEPNMIRHLGHWRDRT